MTLCCSISNGTHEIAISLYLKHCYKYQVYVTHPNPLLLQQVSIPLTWDRYTLGRNQYRAYSLV